MFHGSIPEDMRRIVREHVSTWPRETPVYVGCSGNFTVERSIATLGRELHSCDVLMYSSAIGSYYAGKPLDLRLTPLALEEFPFLEPFVEGPSDQLATMLLCSRLTPYVGKHNAYYDQVRRAYVSQFPGMHAKTKAKVEALDLRLASYSAEDVMTWMERVPADAGVVSYPPFHGAQKAFVRDFATLETLFEWEPPPFTEMDDDALQRLFDGIMDRPSWLLGTNQPIDGLEDRLVGKTRTTNRAIPIYVYSDTGPRRLVNPHQAVAPFMAPHLAGDMDLGERLGLAVLTHDQFAHLRSMYMNKNIRPGSESLALAVLCDGVLIGVFAYSWAPTLGNWGAHLPLPAVYLLSDFPVSSSKYRKLSKLVVMAAVSKEAQQLAMRYGHKRWRSMATTAFTKRPVSMKYRGILRLLKRGENKAVGEDWAQGIDPTDSYYGQKFALQYGGLLGERTLAETLAEWKKRYGDDVRDPAERVDQDA